MKLDQINSVPISKKNPAQAQINRKPDEYLQKLTQIQITNLNTQISIKPNRSKVQKLIKQQQQRDLSFFKQPKNQLIFITKKLVITYKPTKYRQHQNSLNKHNFCSNNLNRINADNISFAKFAIYWTIFLSIIIVALITIAIFPSYLKLDNVTQLHDSDIKNCHNPHLNQTKIKCGVFNQNQPLSGLVILNLVPQNQFAIINVKFITVLLNSDLNLNQKISILLHQIVLQNDSLVIKKYQQDHLIDQQQAQIVIDSKSQKIYQNGSIIGYQAIIAMDRDLINFCNNKKQCSFFIQITFHDTNQLNNLKNVEIQASVINPSFTNFVIIVRLILFFVSVIALLLYVRNYKFAKKVNYQHSFQQKIIIYLSICLILFNDPLYAVTILAPNFFNLILSSLSIITIPTFLLFIWMTFTQRIYYESRQNHSNLLTKKKILYFFVLIVFTQVLYIFYLFHDAFHPLIPISATSPAFLLSVIAVIILYTLGIIYTLVLMSILLYRYFKIRRQETLLWRNTAQLFSTVGVMIALTVVYLIGGFSMYDNSAPRIIIFYGLSNFYVFYLQYMYSAPKLTLAQLKYKQEKHSQNKQLSQNMSSRQLEQIDLVQVDFSLQQICNQKEKSNNLMMYPKMINGKKSHQHQNYEIDYSLDKDQIILEKKRSNQPLIKRQKDDNGNTSVDMEIKKDKNQMKRMNQKSQYQRQQCNIFDEQNKSKENNHTSKYKSQVSQSIQNLKQKFQSSENSKKMQQEDLNVKI